MDFHVAVPGPFTYLVHEHARSIIAIQELQQEVTSLLEFRDHVLEALPHLHHTRPFHSLTPAPTHDPPPAPRPAPPPTTRAESSPSKAAHAPLSGGEGARQPRAISAGGGGGGGGNSSSSSTGGKSLSETHSSSAVADSGFSTDKAGGSMGKSSSSSAGDHLSGADDPRWTSVEPDLPLGSAEDELWHLLDVIQRKGTRLRHELERAERCERDRLSAGPAGGAQGAPHHHHHHHHHPAAPASDPLSSPRHPHPAAARDYWPHSLPGPTAADLLPPPPPPPPVGVALEAEAWAAVDRLRQDRQYLIGRVGWAEAEAAASHQRLVDLHGQLLALAGDKRRLEDQVRALRLDAARPEPLLPAAAAAAAASSSSTLSTQGGVHTVTIVADHAATTTTTTTSRPRRPSPAVTVSVAGSDGGEDGAGGAGRGRVRSASSVRLNADRERDVVLPRVLKVPIKERAARTSSAAPAAPAAPREAAQEEESRRGSDRVVIERERRAGRADGGFSMPVSLLKGARVRVTPNKQRISAILREKDVLELQRQLLTTVMEAEVLKKQIESASEEWASKTSEWESDHRHALAAVTSLKEENSRLKQQLEARPKAPEKRDIGVCAAPVMFTTSTMTGGSVGEEEEDAPTHTVHAGPNVKYDVVVHEERRGDSGARRPAVGVEKPPRRSREPRNAPSPAPPLRETAESPGGKDSLGRAAGARGRATLSQSGRCTPTGTPRSSPAPSITPRMCTARATPQDARASPLSRSTVTRSTLHRRDSLKAAQAKGGKAAGGGGGSGAPAGGQAKIAPPLSPDQSSVSQPRSMRQAPRSPLTLADLRTPSPAPPPAPATRPTPGHRGAKGVPGRRLGGAAGVLHSREASRAGAGPGLGLGAGVGAGRGVRSGSRGVSSPQELRLSHLRPATPSPSPPASCSSFYDSINSDGPPQAGHAPPSHAPASPTQDRLMQVEVAFEWSPVNPSTQIWPCTPITQITPATHPQWLSPRLPPAHSPRPWPPDSLEATGEPETGHVGQLGHGTLGHARGRLESPRVRPRVRSGGGGGGLSPRQDQDLNSRVHQILTRIASGGQ